MIVIDLIWVILCGHAEIGRQARLRAVWIQSMRVRSDRTNILYIQINKTIKMRFVIFANFKNFKVI